MASCASWLPYLRGQRCNVSTMAGNSAGQYWLGQFTQYFPNCFLICGMQMPKTLKTSPLFIISSTSLSGSITLYLLTLLNSVWSCDYLWPMKWAEVKCVISEQEMYKLACALASSLVSLLWDKQCLNRIFSSQLYLVMQIKWIRATTSQGWISEISEK